MHKIVIEACIKILLAQHSSVESLNSLLSVTREILFGASCTLVPSEKRTILTLIPLGSGEKVGGGSRGVALSLIGTGTGRLCGMGGGGSFE